MPRIGHAWSVSILLVSWDLMTTKQEKARRMRLRRRVGARAEPQLPAPRGPTSPYSIAHACFCCRKSFKIVKTDTPTCPDCAGSLHQMGRSFKAPKKSDAEQWKKVEKIWHAGFRFWSYSSHPDAEPLPERLRDVDAFIEAHPSHPMRIANEP